MIRLCAVFAAALTLAPAAAAHWGDTWYWHPRRAEAKLLTNSRVPGLFGGDYVSDVDCAPVGLWIWSSSRPRVKLYKHFDCGFNVNFTDPDTGDVTYQTYERILHVISAQDFVLSTP